MFVVATDMAAVFFVRLATTNIVMKQESKAPAMRPVQHADVYLRFLNLLVSFVVTLNCITHSVLTDRGILLCLLWFIVSLVTLPENNSKSE